MLAFRMDETTFAQGDRSGLRIVTGAGLRVDFDEAAPDADTLGLWHLHHGACQGEGTGLEDASGGGHPLTNSGAEVQEDGYRFVRAEADVMDADLGAQPARSALTLEAWVRAWQPSAGEYGLIALFYDPATLDMVYLVARRSPTPAQSEIWFTQRIAGNYRGARLWSGEAADQVLASAQPWHVAGVLNGATPFLYVNGVARGQVQGATLLPLAGRCVRLGRSWSGAAWDLSAVVDEVRLSAAVRYSGTFSPHRLLASGVFTSPTFDAVRLAADWLDLVRDQTVPPGCAAAWDVRAADALDVSGDPQASWAAWSGDPAAPPDGRYLQWRVTASATADRFTSPTVASAEARASEAGYDLFHAAGEGPESVDYAEPSARVGPGVGQVRTAALEPGAGHWFGLRPVDAQGRQSPVAQDEVRLELDGAGEAVGDRPAGVLGLAAVALPGGRARLTWRYRVGAGGVVPQALRVFGDGGSGVIDYGSPLGEAPWQEGKLWYSWTSDNLAEGAAHQLAVRAVTAGGLWDEQPAVAGVTPDATPPACVDALEAETAL